MFFVLGFIAMVIGGLLMWFAEECLYGTAENVIGFSGLGLFIIGAGSMLFSIGKLAWTYMP